MLPRKVANDSMLETFENTHVKMFFKPAKVQHLYIFSGKISELPGQGSTILAKETVFPLNMFSVADVGTNFRLSNQTISSKRKSVGYIQQFSGMLPV